MDVVDLNAGFGERTIISGINLKVEPNSVTALIGPSGCGKSTLLRCLNAMHRTATNAFVNGEILLDGVDINARGVDPVLVRRRVGMVFQRPNPFPTMSIYDNVAAGLRLTSGRTGRHRHDETVERALRQADLWAEVKDRLRSMGGALSGGQQQRLCIARALAVEPEVLLMDEPCSALDPISTAKIEETIHAPRAVYDRDRDAQHAAGRARLDTTAFMTILEAGQPGALVETGPDQLDLRLRPPTRSRARTSPAGSARGDGAGRSPASWNRGSSRSRDLVRHGLRETLSALELGDSAIAQRVIEADDEVDRLCLALDRDAEILLVGKVVPARDIALVLASTRIARNLERMADQCVTIAKLVQAGGNDEPGSGAVRAARSRRWAGAASACSRRRRTR